MAPTLTEAGVLVRLPAYQGCDATLPPDPSLLPMCYGLRPPHSAVERMSSGKPRLPMAAAHVKG